MKTALLAWELGGGSGHIVVLRQVAEQLLVRGFRVVAALKDISAAGDLSGLRVEILQAPVWPRALRSSSVTLDARSSSSTMGDVLATLGLANAVAAGAIIRAWRGLLDLVRPDLAIGEFAPGLALAARGRVPVGLMGAGYCLPPSHLPHFPALHDLHAPLWSEDDLTATINHHLSAFGAARLERLPQLFEADLTFVSTLPVLDPYRQVRLRPADGPLLSRLPDIRRAEARDILVYLSPGVTPPAHVIKALLPHGAALQVYAPALAADDAQRLRDHGARLFEVRQPFETLLQNCRLVIHYGVAGTAAMALLAGVPQLALSLDIEKDLNGQALEGLGTGKLLKIHNPAIQLDGSLIGDLVQDQTMADRALSVAGELRAEFKPDPLAPFIAACSRLAAGG